MTAYLATLLETGLAMRVDALPSTPLQAGTEVRCTEVRSQSIPLPTLWAAHHEVEALTAELRIPFPRIRWFAPVGEEPHDATFLGALHRSGLRLECEPDDFMSGPMPTDNSVLGGQAVPEPYDGRGPLIKLLHSLRGDLLRMVIAHEMRHLAQPDSMTRHEREEDAERFGMAHVA
jgi:hypothetical protein